MSNCEQGINIYSLQVGVNQPYIFKAGNFQNCFVGHYKFNFHIKPVDLI